MSELIQKIDKNLLSITRSLQNGDCEIKLIIYSQNLPKTKSELSKIEGVRVLEEFAFIGAVATSARPECIEKISRIKSVVHITYSTSVFAQIEKSKRVLKTSQFYEQGLFGEGIVVAVIDTGCFCHFDLSFPENRVVFFKDFVNEKNLQYDDNGHGTFVSGLICGNGLMSGGKFFGVAPKCKLIVLKTLDENGQTSALKILEAMQWVFENKEKFNIKIVCMSFGAVPLGAHDPLVNGAEQLWKKGVVVVVAAGNSGPDKKTIKSPGVSPKVITVGALDATSENFSSFKIADFSSRGPTPFGFKPDVIAPGVDIVGLSNGDDVYKKLSGTSMSAPIVAGICALMLEKWPNLTPNQVKMELIRSGQKIVFDRNIEGAGVVDCSKIIH